MNVSNQFLFNTLQDATLTYNFLEIKEGIFSLFHLNFKVFVKILEIENLNKTIIDFQTFHNTCYQNTKRKVV